jgi:hypothetical protein
MVHDCRRLDCLCPHRPPGPPVVPVLATYTAKNRATMIFDNDGHVVSDPQREPRLLWSRVVQG